MDQNTKVEYPHSIKNTYKYILYLPPSKKKNLTIPDGKKCLDFLWHVSIIIVKKYLHNVWLRVT